MEKEFQNAIEYLDSLTALGWKPGLERFTELCRRLESPHERVKFVHVSGTNGKGSTTAMISAILTAAGYKTGSYYSPYVRDMLERVQIDGSMIDEDSFVRLIDIIKPHAAALGKTEMGHPTEFEVKTALALMYLAEQGVDFAVLEVGLGGRLDATNIVTPLVSVITNVTLDHADRLGNTIREIAWEKAGIVKRGGHLVTAAWDSDALDVIRGACEERGSLIWYICPGGGNFSVVELGIGDDSPPCWDLPYASGLTVTGQDFRYEDLKVGMRGGFQFVNGAVAVAACEALRLKGASIPRAAVREGLISARMPGRLEVIREKPTLLLDGAHNLDGAKKLAEALENWFDYDKLFLIMGMSTGHSIEDVVGTLAPMADTFYACAADNPRAVAAELVAEAASKYCEKVILADSVNDAVRRALDEAGENDLVCVSGSFYVVGEVVL